MSAIDALRAAFGEKKLTLYIGAGVSIESGLPSWEGLVQAMYFRMMDQERLGNWSPLANYLFAISDWQIDRLEEPLEITARKIRRFYGDNQTAFLTSLHETLYEGFRGEDEVTFDPPAPDVLREGNPTLDAVAALCLDIHQGVDSVVTYNYDALLETALDNAGHFESIWHTDQQPHSHKSPLYHVHGYVPFDPDTGSDVNDIVFTEDQYNLVAINPYSWSNLVQIHCMSSNVGLMVGLSLSDRNMRRLFDAVRSAPIDTTHYAILKRRTWAPPTEADLEQIHEKAQWYMERFYRSGFGNRVGRKGPSWRSQVRGILQEVQRKSNEQETQVLNELGIHPIWIDSFDEVPEKLAEIMR